jgi:hypothetical protein
VGNRIFHEGQRPAVQGFGNARGIHVDDAAPR